MSRRTLWVSIVGSLALVGATAAADTPGPLSYLARFAEVLALVEAEYVEPVDLGRAVDGAIAGMVKALDPHSTYLDPEAYRAFSESTAGRFAGIGVAVGVEEGWLTVLTVFEGGPADRAGIAPGDRFVTIDGRGARDLPLDDAVELMRGEPGTRVNVTMRRPGQREDEALELERAIVAIASVEGRLLSDGVVYVRLRAFQERTAEQLRRVLDLAVAEAEDRGGIRGLMLDLRSNGGGLLHESVFVADEFLRHGVIVSTRGRADEVIEEVKAVRRGTRPDWPMVVLVDGYTASAAEIVAGALRDHGRASIVGMRTFGKGSVQSVIPLEGGGAVKLTIARYFTPNGTSIQAHGIEPDMEVPALDPSASTQARDAMSEASLEGHLEGTGEPDGDVDASGEPLSRGGLWIEPRRSGARSVFPRDYQAHMGHQALRAIIAQARR